ncbi:MAG TPA: Hsp70 family protein [Amycolatopsis sp.]|uniref:Hsp70 family protein n=1 Tax=Amycolatopsis sp. TaxID=37632 RepID=UPI002B47E097|nr:Hsp70 family protein [Amycolatopsis sp.]HKS49842.1 Hsp70 family protein [Amycolatopsis sp.]
MTAIGIDLGTTNSVVATYDPERARARVVTIDGARSTPSVVSIKQQDGAEELQVGQNAVNWANVDPENTILSVKRLMGRDFADPAVEEARSRRSYRIVPGPNDDPRAHVVIRGAVYSPAEVSTFILERLKKGASETLNTDVTHAVITVPAYFEEAQRAATREAGEQAGLVVKRIIDEPTAAAIAFGLELGDRDRRRVLVYDLGGGTFDISVLNVTRDKRGHLHFQVMVFNGDNWLGGDDFDALIVDRIVDWVKRRADVDPSGDAEFMFRAKKAAEEAKRFLSANNSADIVIPYAYKVAGDLIDVTMTLTRNEFNELIEPLVEKTISLVKAVLDDQTVTTTDISDVLLVGGATLTPKVYETVEELFGKGKVRRHIDPMECVAIGAGVLANTLHGVECQNCKKVNDESADKCAECRQSLINARSAGDTNVHDVTGMALGVNAVKGSHSDAFVPIIPRGTPYPMSEPMRHGGFGVTDGRLIRVPVYEGDHPLASQNREQGVIEYELPEEIDVHSRVDVAFMFDRNRELHVTITVPGTGLEYRKKLRIDAPRTKTSPDTSPAENEDTTYRTDLTLAQQAIANFLRNYGEYLDPPQAMKIRGDFDRAAQVLIFAEPEECRRMLAILESDLFNSGLASALYLAERAADRATSMADAQQINQTVRSVRDAFRDGKRGVVHEQARVLKVLVANSLNRQEVVEIHDAEDYAGLLKLLES